MQCFYVLSVPFYSLYVKYIINKIATNICIIFPFMGSRRVDRDVPGSLCYREATVESLMGPKSLSRGVRCEMQFSSPKTVCAL